MTHNAEQPPDRFSPFDQGEKMTQPKPTQPAWLYADDQMQTLVATVQVPAPFYPDFVRYDGNLYRYNPGYTVVITDIYDVPTTAEPSA